MNNNGVNRILMREVRSRYHLKPVDCKNVLNAGFTDDSLERFEITFEIEGGKKIDMEICFRQRKPELFISEPYI